MNASQPRAASASPAPVRAVLHTSAVVVDPLSALEIYKQRARERKLASASKRRLQSFEQRRVEDAAADAEQLSIGLSMHRQQQQQHFLSVSTSRSMMSSSLASVSVAREEQCLSRSPPTQRYGRCGAEDDSPSACPAPRMERCPSPVPFAVPVAAKKGVSPVRAAAVVVQSLAGMLSVAPTATRASEVGSDRKKKKQVLQRLNAALGFRNDDGEVLLPPPMSSSAEIVVPPTKKHVTVMSPTGPSRAVAVTATVVATTTTTTTAKEAVVAPAATREVKAHVQQRPRIALESKSINVVTAIVPPRASSASRQHSMQRAAALAMKKKQEQEEAAAQRAQQQQQNSTAVSSSPPTSRHQDPAAEFDLLRPPTPHPRQQLQRCQRSASAKATAAVPTVSLSLCASTKDTVRREVAIKKRNRGELLF